ncbi:MAG: hypothetical protein ABEL76_00725, partial [Bradymonadaceae bacterium]
MGDGSFDAPSDFEGQGSSGTSIWVWLGAGCLGLLVLFGAVLAFGIYRGVECYETARKRQSQMRSTAQSFAVAVREGSYRSAWRQMSTGYREQTTFEEFRGVFQTQAEKLGDGPVRL